jgi:Flp pilus assembly protein TadG
MTRRMRILAAKTMLAALAARWRRMRCEAGNTSVMFALMIPVVMGAAGIGVDYVRAAAMRTKMQAVADAAAVSSARELQMAKSDPDKIAAIATSYVASQLPDVSVQTKVDAEALTVQVVLQKDLALTLAGTVWRGDIHLKAAATAKMTSGLPLCLVGLDTKAAGTIKLEESALLTAPACLVYSDSKSPQGLMSLDNAVLRAGFICTAGGKLNTNSANFTPMPQTDCPVIPDPLAARQPPSVSGCSATNQVIDGGIVTLSPGVYCGGLRITNGAQVTFSAGTFVIKDGPLIVNNNADVRGTNVAFYLSGAGANLVFEAATTINLTAPKDGPLTGILFFDDPSGAPAPVDTKIYKSYTKQGKSPREHLILSDNARTLLGTIYMPQGRLIIDATAPIADRSAYTVLVVNQLDLYSGPNLVLNTDYSASDVPVPQGLGPFGGKVLLAN